MKEEEEFYVETWGISDDPMQEFNEEELPAHHPDTPYEKARCWGCRRGPFMDIKLFVDKCDTWSCHDCDDDKYQSRAEQFALVQEANRIWEEKHGQS